MNHDDILNKPPSGWHRKTHAEQIKALFERAEARHQRWRDQNIKVDFETLEKVYEGWV